MYKALMHISGYIAWFLFGRIWKELGLILSRNGNSSWPLVFQQDSVCVLISTLLVPTCHQAIHGAGSLRREGAQYGATEYSSGAPLWKIIRMYYCLVLPSKSQSTLAQHSGGSGSSTMKISWICIRIPEDLLFPYFYQEVYKMLVFIDTAKNVFHKQRNGREETHTLELWWVLGLEGQSWGQGRRWSMEPCISSLHQHFCLWASPSSSWLGQATTLLVLTKPER